MANSAAANSPKVPRAKRCIKTCRAPVSKETAQAARKHRVPKGALRQSFNFCLLNAHAQSESTERQKVH